MNKKIIIENLVAKLKEEPETELHSNDTIRFEHGENFYCIRLSEKNGIEIIKKNHYGEEQLRVMPLGSNKIKLL